MEALTRTFVATVGLFAGSLAIQGDTLNYHPAESEQTAEASTRYRDDELPLRLSEGQLYLLLGTSTVATGLYLWLSGHHDRKQKEAARRGTQRCNADDIRQM